MSKLVIEGKIEGYCLPQGVIVQPSRVKVQVEVVKGEAPASTVTNDRGAEKNR